MSTSKFLAGAACGFIAGILLAPEKGANTRANLSNSANKLRDGFNRLTGKTAFDLDDLRDYLEHDIEGLTEDVRLRIQTMIDESEELAYNPAIDDRMISNNL